MSIASELTRISDAKADLKRAINAKGGTLVNERLSEYASAVDALLPEDFGNRIRFIDYDGTVLKTMFIAEGESAFIPKGHPGNRFAALHVSKNLSELERLRLMVAKLEIENERLKKGYWVEGVGANKVFVTGPDKNTKLSKR